MNLRRIYDPEKNVSIKASETTSISEAEIVGPSKEIREFYKEVKNTNT